jgi:tight adherence protein C
MSGMDTDVMIAAGVAVASLLLGLWLLVGGRKDPVAERLAELSGGGNATFPAASRVATFPTASHRAADRSAAEADENRDRLKERIVHAGLYKPHALAVFIAARVLLFFVPVALGIAAGSTGMMPRTQGILLGVLAGGLGTLAPSFWLDHKKRVRQTKIRRALPDALDVIVVCLEGGLSVPSALARVARELGAAHPMLGLELMIVEREIQMGRPTGDAIRQFAQRFDLEELRSLASVVTQAERFGTSISRALTVYADSMRTKRHQRAEAMAQKAAVKILFPTLFCIFPGIFIVILGPAAIQIYQMLIKGMLTQGS